MKYKKWLLVLAACMLAGCGQPGTEKVEQGALQSVESETAEKDNGEVADASENADDSAAENGAAAGEASEDAPYVLTFEAQTIEGEAVTSDCFADSKLTMLNIWGTYCNPCLKEMPDLGEIAATYDKADFQIMGIICDVQEGADEDALNNAKALIEETKANYPHLLLNESLYTNLVGGTDAVPTTFFVNQKGEVLGYIVGANSKEGWVNLIEQLLAEEQ